MTMPSSPLCFPPLKTFFRKMYSFLALAFQNHNFSFISVMKVESGTVSDFSLTRLRGSYNVYEPRTMDECTGDNLILGFRDKGIYGVKVLHFGLA